LGISDFGTGDTMTYKWISGVVGSIFLLLPACQTAITVINPKIGETESVWENSIERDPQGNIIRRFIPVELFTGAKWDGTNNLTTNTPVNNRQNPGKTLHVQAPMKGVHGNTVVVRNNQWNGHIYQEFDINKYGDGMAMTYQNRRGVVYDHTVTENKFPLGWWTPKESRRYCDYNRTQLTILDLDYGTSHGIKFFWKIPTCGKECEGVYVFVPDGGLLSGYMQPYPEGELPDGKSVCG
jgi:hypothetical protein